MQHEQPLVARHRGPADRLKALARAIPELCHRASLEVDDADRAVAAVSVFGVRDRNEALVAREVGDGRALRMLVDESRRLAVAEHIHRRAVVAPRSPEHGEARSRSEPRAVRGRELGRDRLGGPAYKWRADPAAELVPLLVVEPPDALAGWVEPARHPVSRAFDAIRDPTMPIHPAIPRVDLEASPRVRDIDEPGGSVTCPRRESEPGR